MNFKDITGRRFGRLVAMWLVPKQGWRCQCDCGNVVTVERANLARGTSQSCGCLRLEQTIARSTKHGGAGTRTYNIWKGIKRRCYDSKNCGYKNYGGRGIKVAPEWLNDFGRFRADLGECPDGFSIERLNNDKDYEPGNCKWIKRSDQSKNRRSNRWLTFNGKTQTLADWARELSIKETTLAMRLNCCRWSIEKALSTH